MRFLLPLFIIIPIVEMWVLIEVGARIGALPTIALVFLTAAIGLALLRQQGLSTLLRADQRMAEGQLPAQEVLEGILLAVGGALLLTPGFITDAFGFACLLPPTRKLLVASLLKQAVVTARFGAGQPGGHAHYHGSETVRRENGVETHTIEGEFRRED